MMYKLFSLAIAALVMSTSVNAAEIPLGDGYGWLSFTYDGDGTSWSDSFIFTISEASTLKVSTFGASSGDTYEVFADGFSLGVTSPTVDPVTFATGEWVFQAGTYQVSGVVITTNGFGEGFISLETGVSAVPVPTAAWLFGSSLIG